MMFYHHKQRHGSFRTGAFEKQQAALRRIATQADILIMHDRTMFDCLHIGQNILMSRHNTFGRPVLPEEN